jgi:hypothetical protein
MKSRTLRILFCIFAMVLPALAQSPAHESTIDGSWVAKVTAQGSEQVTRFEFKNGDGEVSGTVTEGEAQPLVIKNGRLDGFKLTFDTVQVPHGGGDPIMMSWSGTVVGAGESIKLTRTASDDDGIRGSQEFEAKRAP